MSISADLKLTNEQIRLNAKQRQLQKRIIAGLIANVDEVDELKIALAEMKLNEKMIKETIKMIKAKMIKIQALNKISNKKPKKTKFNYTIEEDD